MVEGRWSYSCSGAVAPVPPHGLQTYHTFSPFPFDQSCLRRWSGRRRSRRQSPCCHSVPRLVNNNQPEWYLLCVQSNLECLSDVFPARGGGAWARRRPHKLLLAPCGQEDAAHRSMVTLRTHVEECDGAVATGRAVSAPQCWWSPSPWAAVVTPSVRTVFSRISGVSVGG